MATAIGIIIVGIVVLGCAALIYFSDVDEDDDGTGR